jgi:hypothetical protein
MKGGSDTMKIGEVLLLTTRGFSQIQPDIQAEILEEGLKRIQPKAPDFIIFDSKVTEEQKEDEGRSVRLPSRGKEKVYAKLDDFGSSEALSESSGFKVNTRYALTFMLAEEY